MTHPKAVMEDRPGSRPQSELNADGDRRQLEKIVRSSTFHSSPVLQRFLEHVVVKTIQGLSDEIKEYEIAIEVLGRSADFDPRLDTTVRAQAHRLREKLEEYYASEGADDDVRIELPKGHYIPQFVRRHAEARHAPNAQTNGSGSHEAVASIHAGSPPGGQPVVAETNTGRHVALWLGFGAVGAALFIAGFLISPVLRGKRVAATPVLQGHSAAADPLSPTVQAVWSGFFQGSDPALVAYSNSIFLVTETSDLLRLNAADVEGLGAPANGREMSEFAANPALVRDAGPVFFDDDHTGTGEVMAVFYLTRLFSRARAPVMVERSQLIKTADLRTHNLIFLGAVSENPILAGLPLNQNFVLSEPRKPPTLWRNRILNLHPRAGEEPFYAIERDPRTQVLRTDYAVVSFLPGVVPGRKIAILAGLTTIGTQAAAQFVTSEAGAKQLAERLKRSGRLSSAQGLPPFFQAVLKVSIEQDEILSIECVAARAINSPQRNN